MTTRCSEKGLKSTYFSYEDIRTNELETLFNEFIGGLPKWMTELFYHGHWDGKLLNEQTLLSFIKEDYMKLMDTFVVSLGGTDPSKGSAPQIETTIASPRRLMLTWEAQPPSWSKFYKCTIGEGYGYSYSFVVRSWMGCRSIRDYPVVCKIGIAVWRRVREYLDPISQLIPPNGANILYYFGLFNGKIRAHQDAAPNMATNPMHTSQILGSSVMVVSFCDEQLFNLIDIKKKNIVMSFKLGHMSVYILRSEDDIKYKHQATFADTDQRKKKEEKLRIAIAYRWLGRRTKFFGNDCKTRRRNMECITRHNMAVKEKFPRCLKSQANFFLKNNLRNPFEQPAPLRNATSDAQAAPEGDEADDESSAPQDKGDMQILTQPREPSPAKTSPAKKGKKRPGPPLDATRRSKRGRKKKDIYTPSP